MTFSQSLYTIDEDKGSVQLLLILSNPSPNDITITVICHDGSATGKNMCIHTYSYACKNQVTTYVAMYSNTTDGLI